LGTPFISATKPHLLAAGCAWRGQLSSMLHRILCKVHYWLTCASYAVQICHVAALSYSAILPSHVNLKVIGVTNAIVAAGPLGQELTRIVCQLPVILHLSDKQSSLTIFHSLRAPDRSQYISVVYISEFQSCHSASRSIHRPLTPQLKIFPAYRQAESRCTHLVRPQATN